VLRTRDQIVGRDVELFMRVMRMRADRAGHARKALGDAEHLRMAAHPRRDRHHATDSGRRGARHHRVELGANSGKSRWQ